MSSPLLLRTELADCHRVGDRTDLYGRYDLVDRTGRVVESNECGFSLRALASDPAEAFRASVARMLASRPIPPTINSLSGYDERPSANGD